MKSKIKDDIIKKFRLQPHPEGGFFREVYRSKEVLQKEGSERNISTAIYYLLEGKDFSAFHRIKSDEIWHFYSGATLEIVEINPKGKCINHLLGNDFHSCEPQMIIPAGSWFAAHLKDENSFAFVGCTVAPGFDFQDFEMAQREELIKQYPLLEETIVRFTRE